MVNNMKEKKPRSKNFTPTEVYTMCSFVKLNRPKLFGKAGHSSQKVEDRKKRYWTKSVDVLRAAGGHPDRTWESIKKKWIDLKVQANKYAAKQLETGGGPPVKFDPLLEAVLEAMAEQTRYGVRPSGQCETDPMALFSSMQPEEYSQDSDMSSQASEPPSQDVPDIHQNVPAAIKASIQGPQVARPGAVGPSHDILAPQLTPQASLTHVAPAGPSQPARPVAGPTRGVAILSSQHILAPQLTPQASLTHVAPAAPPQPARPVVGPTSTVAISSQDLPDPSNDVPAIVASGSNPVPEKRPRQSTASSTREIRSLMIQEEILKVEKDTMEIQRGILNALNAIAEAIKQK